MNLFRIAKYKTMTILLLFIIFIFQEVSSLERKLISSINPNCNVNCNESLLIHIQSIGPNDTLNYLWDFSKKPSLMLALTSHETNLTIDWSNLKNQTTDENPIQFTGSTYYTFGILFTKLIEFNDLEDRAHLDLENKNSSYYREYNTSDFIWKQTKYENSTHSLEMEIEANGQPFNRTGVIRFNLNCYGFRDHSTELPHLLHSSNSTLVELEIDHFSTDSSFNSSRFAIEMVLVSQDAISDSMKLELQKSLDDEHTPGVFTMMSLLTPKSKYNSSGGYLQWRPVSYVAKQRAISNSTETTQYNLEPVMNPLQLFNNSILLNYYGYNLSNNSDILIQKTFVSFGLKEDGFYKKTHFYSWSFIYGYGKPANENFSLLVILVISIGLGLPTLLIIISGIVMAVTRVSRNKHKRLLSS